MLIDYLVAFGKWNWLILAAIFFVIELVAPGAFMMWLGLASLLVAAAVGWLAYANRDQSPKPGDAPDPAHQP